MVRLFVVAGLFVLLNLALLFVTGLAFFRWATLILSAGILLLFVVLRRGLAPNRGRLRLPGLSSQVEIHVDDQGVPHIYARSLTDLYRSQGFITARDRLFSMELTRRAAAGRLAELFGEQLLPSDRLFRTLGLRRRAEAAVSALPPDLREALEAYAAGVNARIGAISLPPEFLLLRVRPEPWTPADCLAVARYLACSFTADWTGTFLQARLLQAVGPEKTAELLRDPASADELQALSEAALPELDELLRTASATFRGDETSPRWASAAGEATAQAVTGARTATGKPLLTADLLQPPASPARWYQVHLVGPEGLDVIGASLPGLPGVLFGHNRELAWGLAGVPPHQARLFVEERDQDRPYLVRHQGTEETAEVFPESIGVRGKAEPVVHEVLVTSRGPVIARSETAAVTIGWPALEPDAALRSLLAVNRARSWAECQTALGHSEGPALSLLVACRDGTTARVSVGQEPGESAPAILNPPEGFLLSAATEHRTEGYRSLRAAERFQGATGLTAEKIRLFQADVVNLRVRSLLRLLLSAVHDGLQAGTHPEALNDLEKRALLMLSGWDGEEPPDAPQPALWHQWYHFLVEEIFRPQMGRALFDQFIAFGQPNSQADRLIRAAAAGEASAWLAPEGEGSLARTSLRSFRRAVALLAAKQGSRPDRWRWGREHRLSFPHPIGSQSRLARLFLGLGPYPAPGSSVTVFPHASDPLAPFQVRLTPTWRQVVDLAAPEESWVSFAPGQSEHPFSANFADQVTAWLKGEYRPELYRHGTIRQLPSLTLLP